MPGEEDYISILYVAGSAFVLLLVIFIFTYIYLHQRKVERFNLELRDREIKKQRELFIAVNEGEEKERKRISEELHDGIGAKLSGLKMSMEYLLSEGKMNQDDLLLLKKVSEGMNESIKELREISHNLTPSVLANKGLEALLRETIGHFNLKQKCSYNLYIETLPPQSEKYHQVIYRIVSELLANIEKHSRADLASVQLIAGESSIQLLVEDNGKGFDTASPGSGIGLTNIANRVALYNGKLNYDSSEKGTFIIIEFQLD